MNLKELLGQVTSKADSAAIFLGYAGGFGLDAFFFDGGVSPGATAGVFAIATLGAAKLIASLPQFERRSLQRRAAKLLPLLRKHSLNRVAEELERERDIHQRGLTTTESFAACLERTLVRYRELTGGHKSLNSIDARVVATLEILERDGNFEAASDLRREYHLYQLGATESPDLEEQLGRAIALYREPREEPRPAVIHPRAKSGK